jgi:hypothetical protein
MSEIIRLPEHIIVSDVVPTFVFLVLVLPLVEETGFIWGLSSYDALFTGLLYITLSVILYPLLGPILRWIGGKIFECFDKKLHRQKYTKTLKELMKRYDLDELWIRLSQEEKDELMGYSADRLMYTSLFCVFLAYSVILVVLLFLSPNPSVPIVHQNFKVNKLLLLALSVTAVVVCYFAARSIILMIVEVFYQRLARRYFGS